MMDYEIFKDEVQKRILSFMPLKYKNYQVQIRRVTKVNEILDSLNLIKKGDNCPSVSVYLRDMYEVYLGSQNFDVVLANTANFIDRHTDNINETVPRLDLTVAKDNIVMVLVNTQQNEEMLKNSPHREFEDLSIMYRLVLNVDENGIASTIINNKLMETLNRSEEELYQAALVNTQMKFPPVIKCLHDVVKGNYSDSIEANFTEMSMMPEKYRIYIISNEAVVNGAVVMLYDCVLQKLAEELESDLYILPSSIHEVIAVLADFWNSNELANTVSDINKREVLLKDRLSNQVYFYDRNSKLLSKVTNSSYTRLDGY